MDIGDQMMAPEWKRILSCQDWQSRDRQLRIFLTPENRIGLNTPPGDVATVNIVGAYQVQEHVAAAALEAGQRGGNANLLVARRFQQVHELLDHNGTPRKVGVQTVNGEVFVSVTGWFKGTPAQIRELADSLRVAADVAEQQQLRRS